MLLLIEMKKSELGGITAKFNIPLCSRIAPLSFLANLKLQLGFQVYPFHQFSVPTDNQ